MIGIFNILKKKTFDTVEIFVEKNKQLNMEIDNVVSSSSSSVVVKGTNNSFATPMIYDNVSSIYEDYNMSNDFISSFPNKENQKHGYRWATNSDVKKILGGHGEIAFDMFAISERFTGIKAKPMAQTYISREDMTRSFLVLGAIGSGKTVFLEQFLEQNWYHRCVINDIKGDFVAKFYRQEKDIIVSLYDTRAAAWDIFQEMEYSIELGKAFISNYVTQSIGGEADFFLNSAINEITEAILRAFLIEKTTQKRYEYFENVVEKFENSIGEDKTKSSIFQLMKLALGVFKINAYLIEKGAPIFSISDWHKKKDGQRLFLLKTGGGSKEEKAYFTGILGVIVKLNMLRTDNSLLEDSEKDYTYYALDEFLALAMDAETNESLSREIRSKGGAVLKAVQHMPADQKAKELMDSSKFCTVIFRVSGNTVVEHLVQAFQKTEYIDMTKSTSVSFSKKQKGGGGQGDHGFAASGLAALQHIGGGGFEKSYSTSTSEQIQKDNFLRGEYIQSIDDYHHITFFPSKNIAYLGYQPKLDIPLINECQSIRDMRDFYAKSLKIEDYKLPQDSDNSSKDKTIFIEQLHFSMCDDEEKETFFDNLNVNKEVISGILSIERNEKIDEIKEFYSRYSDEERWNMCLHFFDLDDDNKKIVYAIEKGFLKIGFYAAFAQTEDEIYKTIKG